MFGLNQMREVAVRGAWACALVSATALLVPTMAGAAEVVVQETGGGTPNEVTLQRGDTTAFTIELSATGPISLATRRDSGVGASVDSVFRIGSGGGISAGARSRLLPIYSNGDAFDSQATWDGAPTPYKIYATVTTAPDTSAGVYRIPLTAFVTNPGLSFLGPLHDDSKTVLNVRVVAPLAPPNENDPSVNLLPGSGGTCHFQAPQDTEQVLTEPEHVSVNTRVECGESGHVIVVSDKDNRGGTQRAEFYSGDFRVNYTRQLIPGSDEETSSKPITELTLVGSYGRCRRTRARRATSSVKARTSARRRRLWGRGRGRFRTRGRYGAATVRGTWWETKDSCRGTELTVKDGRVTMRDFGMRRNVTVNAGSSYLAGPPGTVDGTG